MTPFPPDASRMDVKCDLQTIHKVTFENPRARPSLLFSSTPPNAASQLLKLVFACQSFLVSCHEFLPKCVKMSLPALKSNRWLFLLGADGSDRSQEENRRLLGWEKPRMPNHGFGCGVRLLRIILRKRLMGPYFEAHLNHNPRQVE